jgi:hypothetical protein
MSVFAKGLFGEDARYYGRQRSGVGVATPSEDKNITPPTPSWSPGPSLKDSASWRLARFLFFILVLFIQNTKWCLFNRQSYGCLGATASKEVESIEYPHP